MLAPFSRIGMDRQPWRGAESSSSVWERFAPIRSIAPSREDYAAILLGFKMPQMIDDVTIDAFRRDKTRFAGAVKAV